VAGAHVSARCTTRRFQVIDQARSFDDEHTYPAVLSFLLGGLAGASLALLLAPHSGRDTRHAVRRRVRGGVTAARDLKERLARRGSELRDRANRTMSEMAEEAEDAAAAIEDVARSRAQAVGESFGGDRTAL
jgi:gas vesicle protein